MRALLMGYGEIGKGMNEILKAVHEIDIFDPMLEMGMTTEYLKGMFDVLLIAFPWSDQFEKNVRAMQEIIEPDATIIFSTVPIGTCKRLNACHFPIEAKHPHIARDMVINLNNYFGLAEGNRGALQFMSESGLRFKVLVDTDWTEFLKLRSTAIYGLNIEFARYSHKVAGSLKSPLPFDVIKDYDKAHNVLTALRGTPEHARYILDPPEGNIGGHCVVPNARILDEQFSSVLLKEIYREKE